MSSHTVGMTNVNVLSGGSSFIRLLCCRMLWTRRVVKAKVRSEVAYNETEMMRLTLENFFAILDFIIRTRGSCWRILVEAMKWSEFYSREKSLWWVESGLTGWLSGDKLGSHLIFFSKRKIHAWNMLVELEI